MVGASHEWEFKTEKIFLYTRFCLVGHVFTLAGARWDGCGYVGVVRPEVQIRSRSSCLNLSQCTPH